MTSKSSRAEYLLRLDDACPTMDRKRWDSVESVVRRHSLHPIVAVVPANADSSLVRDRPDPSFWTRVRAWRDCGWMIGLHGYSHSLRPSQGGLVPINRRSEFVGLPADEQKRRIREGVQVLETHGATPVAWVAPAHGFDRTTVEALRSESSIRVISDSFSLRPTRNLDFVWLPQQLWHPREMSRGVWTICLHPNEMDDKEVKLLDEFIARHQGHFPEPTAAAKLAVPRGLRDIVFECIFLSFLRMRKKVTARTKNA
ncbi:MAG: DUF2334 domain-containing protein [Spirochaetia bacterium]|jgi:predicted deacetylase